MNKLILLGFGAIFFLNSSLFSEIYDASYKRGFLKREHFNENDDHHMECKKDNHCSTGSTIAVPLKPTVYIPNADVSGSVTVPSVQYANFNTCNAVRVGGGYTICDSSMPPRISICEPGKYSVSFQGQALSTGFVNIYLEELSNLTSTDPIFLGSTSTFEKIFNFQQVPLVGEFIYEFCHISEDNPPSFAIRLENISGFSGSFITYDLVTFLAGTAIKITKIGSCCSPCECDECCSPCCPIVPPSDPGEAQLIERIRPGNGG